MGDRDRPGAPASPAGPARGPQARRIVVAVAVAVVALVGVAGWFVAGEAEVEVLGQTVRCDAIVDWPPDDGGRAAREAFDQRCEQAGDARRERAVVAGLAIAIAAAVVSTWPSRRLTGEALGPNP